MTATIPSLREAKRRLDQRLNAIDEAERQALRALPAKHTWRDVDLISIKHSKESIAAYKEYEEDERQWDEYVAAHADEEDNR